MGAALGSVKRNMLGGRPRLFIPERDNPKDVTIYDGFRSLTDTTNRCTYIMDLTSLRMDARASLAFSMERALLGVLLKIQT